MNIHPFGARLVRLLDHLKGKDDIADLAVFAVPGRFHLALSLKQQKAKLVRQRLVGFQKAEDLLLFLSSQSWINVLFFSVLYLVSDRGA